MVLVILPNQVVSEVLVLECDDDPAREVGKLKFRRLLLRKLVLEEVLAESDVLGVDHLYLVGNELDHGSLPHLLRVRALALVVQQFRELLGLFFIDVLYLLDQLVPEVVDILDFSEVVADGDFLDDVLEEVILVPGALSDLLLQLLQLILQVLPGALTLINILQPISDLLLQDPPDFQFVVAGGVIDFVVPVINDRWHVLEYD
jgi:hypothetical protein